MLRMDLESIANGEGDYSRIPPATRRDCLMELAGIIRPKENKITLVVAEGNEEGLQEHITWLSAYDNIVTIDDQRGNPAFEFRRDPGRNIDWTWEKSRIEIDKKHLIAFRRNAACSSREDVLQLLGELAAGVR